MKCSWFPALALTLTLSLPLAFGQDEDPRAAVLAEHQKAEQQKSIDKAALDARLGAAHPDSRVAEIKEELAGKQARRPGLNVRLPKPHLPNPNAPRASERSEANLRPTTVMPAGRGGVLPRRMLPRDEVWVVDNYREAAPATTLKAHRESMPATAEEVKADRTARVEIGPPATTPPTSPASGRFQVVILGFEVSRQTRDDALENDGRGDEVFLHCAVHHLQGSVLHENFHHTATFGDRNRSGDMRVRAGDAGDNGGLRSGNDVGPRRLASDFPADGFREFTLPLLVFDSELIEGHDAVAIAPSVWEWDDWGLPPGTGALLRFGDFHSEDRHEENRAGRYQAAFNFDSRRASFTRMLSETLGARPEAGSPTFVAGRGYPTAQDDMGGNRPIGMQQIEGTCSWRPRTLLMNYAIADHLSRTEFDSARGVVSLRYTDEGDLQGDYTLHLQVRRVE